MEIPEKVRLSNEELVPYLNKISKSKQPRSEKFYSVAKHVVLFAVAISMILPFLWMISTSLKTSTNVFNVPPQWIPNPVKWDNYPTVFKQVPFLRYIMNTFFYTMAVTFLEVFVSVIVAYGFSRFNFKFKKPLFMFILMTMMIPGEITLVPGYIFWSKIGDFLGVQLINSYVPLVLPAIGGQAAHIFFMSQYFRTIPKDFAEAAYINGADNWKILWKVYAPMSIPAMITIGISTFMGVWNNFLGPLIYLNDPEKFTVQVGLAMFQGMFEINWPVMMAATTISIIPMLFLFFSLQKYFVVSNKQDGVK